MRLYPGKVDTIAAEIITTLTAAGDIEVSDSNEAQLDAAAVLKEGATRGVSSERCSPPSTGQTTRS